MIKNYIWGKVSYNLILEDETVLKYPNTACFTYIRDFNNRKNPIKYINIYNISCEKTKEYTILYLKYIVDMFKITDYEITENSFKFKAYDDNIKNMLIGSLVRFLFENIGYQKPFLDTAKLFLKPLLVDGKCKYRNKFKRFCYFYKQIDPDAKIGYWHIGHSWKPSLTKIKTLDDFNSFNFNKDVNGVNNFFTK